MMDQAMIGLLAGQSPTQAPAPPQAPGLLQAPQSVAPAHPGGMQLPVPVLTERDVMNIVLQLLAGQR